MPVDEKDPRLEQSHYDRFDHAYAKELKEKHGDIWGAGGNERGNEAFEYWAKYVEGDRSSGVLEWVKEREAWAARHFEDGGQFKEGEEPNLSNIGGVIAQIKWGVVGTLGEKKMKEVISVVKEKKNEKQSQFSHGYDEIPHSACLLSLGEFEYEDNGEEAKSAPVKLKARSGQPIDHWYWGRVVHDFAGMRLSKNRISIDYVHDPKEVIGYLNKFDTKTGDLVASGALVPFKDSDRATEIIHKMKQGVPYEASINFGGDGISLEEVQEGQTASVNGYELSGPAVIVREWPLRNVAICPLGADMNTETSAMFTEGKTISAKKYTPKSDQKEINEMSEVASEVKAEEVKSEEVKTEGEMNVESCPTCGRVVDAAMVEHEEVKPSESVEAKSEETKPEEPKKDSEVEMSAEQKIRNQFAELHKQFGAEIASTVFINGGNTEDALRLSLEGAKKELESLKSQVEQSKLSAPIGGTPSTFSSTAKSQKFNLFTK